MAIWCVNTWTVFVITLYTSVVKVCSVVSDSCDQWTVALQDPLSQTRILAYVAISFSRSSSWLRDQTRVSCIVVAGIFFTIWAPRKACICLKLFCTYPFAVWLFSLGLLWFMKHRDLVHLNYSVGLIEYYDKAIMYLSIG